MHIYLKNESDFSTLSKTHSADEPLLYELLKTSLIAKKIGALTSTFITEVKSSKNQKQVTKNWLSKMTEYRLRRFKED